MSFRIGDKVVFTGNDSIQFSDYGVVVDFVTHHDGSTSPIVRFNGDSDDSYPDIGYLEIVEKFPRKLKETTQIDEQTIHFWHLQLQFLEMTEDQLVRMSHIIPNIEWEAFLARNIAYGIAVSINFKDNLATELALHLSGLA